MIGANGCAAFKEYQPSGSFRAAVQGISTTKNNSVTGSNAQVSVNLPKPVDRDWVDAPSVQAFVGLVGQNGFDVAAQATWGMTWSPSKYFNANTSLSLGMDNFYTNLDDGKKKAYHPNGYIFPSLSMNLVLPLNKDEKNPNSLTLTGMFAAKTYFASMRFEGEEQDRARVQPAPGLNIAYVSPLFEVGTNMSIYLNDVAWKQHAVPLWGEILYLKKAF